MCGMKKPEAVDKINAYNNSKEAHGTWMSLGKDQVGIQ